MPGNLSVVPTQVATTRSDEGSPKSKSSSPRVYVGQTGMSDAEITRKELRVANFINDHPLPVLGGCFAVFVVLAVIAMPLFAVSIRGGGAYEDIRSKRQDAYLEMEHLVEQDVLKEATGAREPRVRSLVRSVLTVLYEADADVFTERNIAAMHGAEWPILRDNEYQAVCLLWWLQPELAAHSLPLELALSVDSWRFGGQAPAPDGSQPVCYLPSSPAWLMYNTRVARRTASGVVECAAEDLPVHPPACVGGLVHGCQLVPLGAVGAGGAVAEGGSAPDAGQILTMLRVWNEMMNEQASFGECAAVSPMIPVLRQFVGHDFGSDHPLNETDLTRFRSHVARARVFAGNPTHTRDPDTVSPACHERSVAECGDCSAGRKAGGTQEVCGWRTGMDATQNFGKWLTQRGHVDRLNEGAGDLSVAYLELGLLWEQFVQILIRDALLAIASVAFVLFYMQTHTGSFMLATLGFIQIMMPFVFAFFTYRIVFGIKAFFWLSALSLYIVLSIGADDIFVFFDAWKEALESDDDVSKYQRGRFSWAWRRAFTAMSATSLTTMAAFLITMTSELLAISTFGLFAATLVFWDFTLVMTFFAAALVVHHRTAEETRGCCCCGAASCGACVSCCTCTACVEVIPPDDQRSKDGYRPGCGEARRQLVVLPSTVEGAREMFGSDLQVGIKEVSATQLTAAAADAAALARNGLKCVAGGAALMLAGFTLLLIDRRMQPQAFLVWIFVVVLGILLACVGLNMRTTASQLSATSADGGHARIIDVVSRFLSGTGEGDRRLRFVPGLVLLCFWAAMVGCASQLDADAASNQMLPSWHPLQRFFDLQREFASDSLETVWPVTLVVGIGHDDPIDRSGSDKYDVDDRGTPLWTPADAGEAADFFASPSSQLLLLRVCEEVLNQSISSERGGPGLRLQRTVLQEGEQLCVMAGFKRWLTTGRYVDSNGDAVFAATPEEAASLRLVREQVPFPCPADRFHRLMREFTVMSGKTGLPHEQYGQSVYYSGSGTAADPHRVRAVLMQFNTSLREWNEAEAAIRVWYDAWELFIDEISAGEPVWLNGSEVLRGRVMHTSEIWIHMHAQAVLVNEAIRGAGYSLLIAFSVVLLMTWNPFIALLVSVELVGVVGSVLGLIWVFGWHLGTIESVAMTILVGLSVDYVVHFAVHYVESTNSDRRSKAAETVQGMGATVLGGAATSIGASAMLVACWLQFFFKFGCFFLLTILFSYLWAMFFFVPALSVVGPQGPRHNETFSLRPHFRALYRRWAGKAVKVEPERPAA
eukprot:TRINITY_DN8046_c1_g1_i1.p1 TRINITY_DN8046_c1_g1~~TRINITY_DN8046_c1_g1_i1.p1  ORF type:complete len:1296 (+),score=424.03 TRINITY_DN8046_c1_g1_i1:63-3890(+)